MDGQVSAIAAAYEQLAKYGPMADGLSVSLSSVARALGTSRSNLYRTWPTSADLAADIALFRATPTAGWHAAICRDDGTSLEAALRQSLAEPRSADGVLTRASLSTSLTSSAHARLAAWERGHLEALRRRLRREWGGVHGPWTDISLAVTSIVEGMHLMAAQVTEQPGDPMEAEIAEETVQCAVRIVEFMLEHAKGDDVPLRPDAEAHGEAPPSAVPERLAAALSDGSLDVSDEGGRRLVDMGVLARARGVSERSLYARWPTPDDLHAELYEESVQRLQDAFIRIVMQVFQSNPSGSFTNLMPLIARMNAWFMSPERFPEVRVHLSLTDVLSRPGVLAKVREPVSVGLQVADMQIAAVTAATGYRPRPDVRISTYTQFILGMGMGSHRVTSLHPETLDRRLRYLGEEYIASALGHTAVTRSSTEPIDPSAEDFTAETPPVPPALEDVIPPD